LRRAQPQRALAAIRASLVLEERERAVDRAWLSRVELALKGEAVEFEHVHGFQRALHLREQLADGRPTELGRVPGRVCGEIDELLQIRAVVAILGNGLSPRDGAQRLAEL